MTGSTKLPPFVRRWRAFAYTLGLVRFSVIVLIAALTLLWVDQGQDLIRSVDEGEEFWRFVFGMLLWGFSIWLWARTLLDIRFPAPPYPETSPNMTVPSPELCSYNFWRKHLPRGLGVMAFVAVAVATTKAGAHMLTLMALGSGAAFWLFVIYRRDMSRKLASAMKMSASVSAIGCGDLPPFETLREALRGYRGRIALIMLVVGLIYFITGTFWPYYVGKLGAAVLLFLWAATFLPLGSTLTYWSNKTGVPGLLILFIAAIVFSQWNDNHDIREIDSSTTSTSKRPGLRQALQRWKEDNCSNEACKPFIVVATAGGGVRAAYWTAVVLGEMENRHPDYHKSIFAISGVSGGSVGATVFRTVATHWDEIEQSGCGGTVRDCSLSIIGKDTLGPVAASMLSSDLAQRFWPWPWFPDRAKAFEHAWEKNYAKQTGKDHLANTSFASLSKDNAQPALFLNSTWSDNGRRIVASTLDFNGVEQFGRSNDLLEITGKNLRLSTAMHNSARFPLVSPPGSWSRDGDIQGRLMDGGLFENYGAETALEILDTAREVIGEYLDPRVILISSDPSLGEDLAKSPRREPLKFGYEVLSTFAAYANARVGRGSEAAARLKSHAGNNGNFVHFHMCKDDDTRISPPLGWSLSKQARDVILGYLVDGDGSAKTKCRPENQEILNRVISWIQ